MDTLKHWNRKSVHRKSFPLPDPLLPILEASAKAAGVKPEDMLTRIVATALLNRLNKEQQEWRNSKTN